MDEKEQSVSDRILDRIYLLEKELEEIEDAALEDGADDNENALALLTQLDTSLFWIRDEKEHYLKK